MIEEQLKQAKLACRKMQNIDKDTKIKALSWIIFYFGVDILTREIMRRKTYIL